MGVTGGEWAVCGCYWWRVGCVWVLLVESGLCVGVTGGEWAVCMYAYSLECGDVEVSVRRISTYV